MPRIDLFYSSMKVKLILLVLVILATWSCAPLSKTQTKRTKNYFETITYFPETFRVLNKNVAYLQLEQDNLESAMQTSDDQRVAILIQAIDVYETSVKLPDSLKINVNAMEAYIQRYYLLLPDGFSIYKALRGTTETISGLFGLGGLVGSVLPKNVSLNPERKRKIIKHLSKNHDQVKTSLMSMRNYLTNFYLPKIDSIEQHTKLNFQSMLTKIDHNSQPVDYYTNYNRLVTNFYSRLFLARSLTRSLIVATDSFLKTHDELIASVEQRDKVNPNPISIQALSNELTKITGLLKELEGATYKDPTELKK